MPQEPLLGTKLKIERAKRHIRELEAEITAFHNAQPYRVAFESEFLQGREERVKAVVRDVKEIPIEWSAIIGDIVHNLRAALDLLATDLARANSQTSRTALTSTYFPTGTDRKSFESDALKKIKRLSPTAQRLIRRLEPYTGGKGEAIRELHNIDVNDKHTILVTVGTVLLSNRFSIVPTAEVTELHVPGMGSYPLEDGKELMSFSATDNVPGEINIDTGFNVMFGPGEPFGGQPVLPTIQNLIDFIESGINIIERRLYRRDPNPLLLPASSDHPHRT
jgi:hypothetical protein